MIVFSAVCPESGKARQVSRELIHVISACSCFVFRIELAYACKKCSLLANKFQFHYFRQIHLSRKKNIAENYVKCIPLKQCCVKQYVESWKCVRITDSMTDVNTVRTLVVL